MCVCLSLAQCPHSTLHCTHHKFSSNFGGRSNPSEVDIIMEIVKRVMRAGEIEAQNLSIISPYSKQVQLIKTHLANASLLSRQDYSGVRVGTGEMSERVLIDGAKPNSLAFLHDSRQLSRPRNRLGDLFVCSIQFDEGTGLLT